MLSRVTAATLVRWHFMRIYRHDPYYRHTDTWFCLQFFPPSLALVSVCILFNIPYAAPSILDGLASHEVQAPFNSAEVFHGRCFTAEAELSPVRTKWASLRGYLIIIVWHGAKRVLPKYLPLISKYPILTFIKLSFLQRIMFGCCHVASQYNLPHQPKFQAIIFYSERFYYQNINVNYGWSTQLWLVRRGIGYYAELVGILIRINQEYGVDITDTWGLLQYENVFGPR